MNQATGLDHVGIVGPDLDALAAAFEPLGFSLTPRAAHAGGRTGNRCIMLRDGGYLELLARMPGGTSATLDRFLARHAGAHIIALGIDDPAAVRQRLLQTWPTVPDAAATDRPVDGNDPDGPRARFTLLSPPDQPEGRVHLIRHETRAALWQPRFVRHDNQATALTEIVLSTDRPAVTAAWYSVLAGRPLTPDPAGGYQLTLPHGQLRILPPAALPLVLPGVRPPPAPCFAGISLRTTDGNDAIRRLTAARAIPVRDLGEDLLVDAGGLSIRFQCR